MGEKGTLRTHYTQLPMRNCIVREVLPKMMFCNILSTFLAVLTIADRYFEPQKMTFFAFWDKNTIFMVGPFLCTGVPKLARRDLFKNDKIGQGEG